MRRNPTDNEANLLILAGAAFVGWLVFGRKKEAKAVATRTAPPAQQTPRQAPPSSDTPQQAASSSSPSLSFFALPPELWTPWDGCLRPGFEYQLDFQGGPVNFGVLSSLLSSGLGMVVQGSTATGTYTGTVTACALDAIVPIGAVMRQRRATSSGGFPSA